MASAGLSGTGWEIPSGLTVAGWSGWAPVTGARLGWSGWASAFECARRAVARPSPALEAACRVRRPCGAMAAALAMGCGGAGAGVGVGLATARGSAGGDGRS